ncbi:Aste57867_16277 [Aphanomyces stellatus]|uniref:Aste57867_16277 protein n=1 Tax=Aphanomyces stellatus TaxID=120398 RepID=A0A485L5B2_9STRA|nr:hypothetical protein As57867_016220 [Aphanomyces stellatus]VFT93053.1 Aste57867_16277 [Aphanomyces stellatus]
MRESEVWAELQQCIDDFDLRGITNDDIEDILSQKFQMLSDSHKEETYACLDALPTARLERTAVCFGHILDLVREKPKASNRFWDTLNGVNDERIMHRSLLATLDLCMSQVSALAKTFGSTPMEAQSPLSKGLLAANIYLMWLQIPGGSAYSVFMPFVYQDAFWVLLTWAKFLYAPEIDEAVATVASSGQTKRKQSRKSAAAHFHGFSPSSELSTFGLHVLDALVSLGSMEAFDTDAITVTLDGVISIAALMAVREEPAAPCRQVFLALYSCHGQQVLSRLLPGLTVRDKSLPSGSWDKQKHMTTFHAWALATTDALLACEAPCESTHAVSVLQQLCIRSPEKTDDRKKVVAALVALFHRHVLPDAASTSTFLTFLDSFSRSERVVCRQFAVEAFTQLIVHDNGWTDAFSLLFAVLVQRSRDRSVWVRTKAMAGLTAVLGKGLEKSAAGTEFERVVTAELTSTKAFDETRPTARVWTQLLDLLKERLDDEKKMVRKAALQVLQVLLVKERDMDIVGDIQLKCTDSSILVRKQAMHVLTTLLLKDPTHCGLQNIWNWGILPLVNDPETVVQTSCVELIKQIFLDRLMTWHECYHAQTAASTTVEAVHDQFGQLDRMLLGFFQAATRLLVKTSKVDVPQIIKRCLHGVTLPEAEASSWVLLDELSPHLLANATVVDCRRLTKLWHDKQDENEHTLRMLRVISAVAPRVPALDASKIAAGLQASLATFAFQMNVIPGAIDALGQLKPKAEWSVELWDACDAVLRDTMDAGIQDIPCLQKVLCTMGDLWGAHDKHTARLQSIQRYLLPQFNASPTPSAVRAIAFLALGKVSLANQAIAKESMTMFIRELQTSTNVAIRSNILLILGDLCMQYTSMVEVYVPTIAACFLKSNLLLRRNVLLMLTQLILQGYIKWKDALLHYFLHLVVDENADLAHLARHVLSTSLLQKTPNLFTTKFVETIFVLNNAIMPSVAATHGLVLTADELHALSFPGADAFVQRWKIYQFMLETMTDLQKVDVTGKLTRGILEEVSEQKLPLHANPGEIQDNSIERVMQDALLVLSSPEIKLHRRDGDDDGGDGDDETTAPTSMKDATRNLASKLSKKNLMINVIPVVIGVKHQLEAKRSPVMRYLLHYIQDLMVSYKDEVTDVLNTDPQLAKEIAFDLKQYKATQMAKAKAGSSSSSGRPSAGGGVATTPQLKKHMTPLTRMLRERRMSDSSDDESAVTKRLDFSAGPPPPPQQATPQRHITPIVEYKEFIDIDEDEEEGGSGTSSESDFETFVQRRKKAGKTKAAPVRTKRARHRQL